MQWTANEALHIAKSDAFDGIAIFPESLLRRVAAAVAGSSLARRRRGIRRRRLDRTIGASRLERRKKFDTSTAAGVSREFFVLSNVGCHLPRVGGTKAAGRRLVASRGRP